MFNLRRQSSLDMFDPPPTSPVLILIDDRETREDSSDEDDDRLSNTSADIFERSPISTNHQDTVGSSNQYTPRPSNIDTPRKRRIDGAIATPRTLWNALQGLEPSSNINQETRESEEQVVEQPSTSYSQIAQVVSPERDISPADVQLQKQLDSSLETMQKADLSSATSYGHYMQLKKDKLNYQVNVLSKPRSNASDIFNGVSIFVNGHTDPGALELRSLIQAHGGIYHCYYIYGETTHTVASNLSFAKAANARVNEKFIQAAWIVDSIAAGHRLEETPYILCPPKTRPLNFFTKNKDIASTSTSTDNNKSEPILDARDPNFLQQYYSRSRLHLISTLAQDMKDLVNRTRCNDQHVLTGIPLLDNLKDMNYERSRNASKIIFHVDLDCFFVSVSMRNRPDLIGKPVAITHSKGSSSAPGISEVASCSYTARSAGIRNGMLVRDALRLCPTLVCLPYQFDEYNTVSHAIYNIVMRYTLDIRAVSCDEMYLDCSNLCEKIQISNVIGLAEHIRSVIKTETGCPASIGIGPSVLIARLATRFAKPDGVRNVSQREVSSFISNELIKNIPGVGYTVLEKLKAEFGEMETCRELQQISLGELERIVGKKAGQQLFKYCRGEDDDKDFLAVTVRKSVSCDINYGIRFTKKEEVEQFLKRLAEELKKKLISANMLAGNLTLKIMVRAEGAPVETLKYMGHGICDTYSKSVNLIPNTMDSEVLAKESIKMLNKMGHKVEDLRGIGVHCGRLEPKKKHMIDTKMSSIFQVRKSRKEIYRDCSRPSSNESAQSCSSDHLDISFEKRSKRRSDALVVAPQAAVVPTKKFRLTNRIHLFPTIKKEDKMIPIAYLTMPPSINGAKDKKYILLILDEMFLQAPSEPWIRLLTSFLYDCLRGGYLSSLLHISLHLYRRCLSSSSIHPSWFFAISYILSQIDSYCIQYYEAPMILPAVSSPI